MAFDLTPTAAQRGLARRTHEFAVEVVRPVACEYDQSQEFPWPVLEPTGGPLNRVFGRGAPLRNQLSNAALSAKDRVPEPIMRMAMSVLRPPRK